MAVIATLMSACSSDRGSAASVVPLQEIANGAADSTILMPAELAASGNILIVGDAAMPDVRLVSLDGQLEGILGRPGRGPGEFRRIGGVALGPDGAVAVADAGNRRISIYSRSGELKREIPLSGRVGALAFDAQGRLHVDRRGPATQDTGSGSPTIQVFSSEGFPVAAYGDFQRIAEPGATSLHNEARFAPAHDGGMWILYTYRGDLVRYDLAGREIRRISLAQLMGKPADGPYTQRTGDDPFAYAVVRMPIADDIAIDANGLLYVAALQAPSNGAMYSELKIIDEVGTVILTYPLKRVSRRIRCLEGVLYALVDPQTTGTVAIDRYEIMKN